MKKKIVIENPILARAMKFDATILDEGAPSDPQEFLNWWWREKASSCQSCPLFERRNHVVKPDGLASAPIMIIGEGPGFLEDLASIPLVGPLELHKSECSNCTKFKSCYSNRLMTIPNGRMGFRKAVKCDANYTSKNQAPNQLFLRSAGAIFDGILMEKWNNNFPRQTWIDLYNSTHQEQWTGKSPWYITNTIMCRATDITGLQDEVPPGVATSRCKKHLAYQIAAIQPKIIVVLGDVAKSVILGPTAAKQVTRGEIVESKFGPVISDVHPAFYMRANQKEYVGYGYAKIGDTLEKALKYVGFPL